MATALPELLATKVPPHNLEAERAVLGAALLETESLPRAVEVLAPEHFYHSSHRKMFSAMISLFERGEPVDAITLAEELRRRDQLEEVGGASRPGHVDRGGGHGGARGSVCSDRAGARRETGARRARPAAALRHEQRSRGHRHDRARRGGAGQSEARSHCHRGS